MVCCLAIFIPPTGSPLGTFFEIKSAWDSKHAKSSAKKRTVREHILRNVFTVVCKWLFDQFFPSPNPPTTSLNASQTPPTNTQTNLPQCHLRLNFAAGCSIFPKTVTPYPFNGLFSESFRKIEGVITCRSVRDYVG